MASKLLHPPPHANSADAMVTCVGAEPSINQWLKTGALNNVTEITKYSFGENKIKLDCFMLHENNSSRTNCGKQKL